MKYCFIALLLTVTVYACSTHPNNKITTIAAFGAGPMDKLYGDLRPKIQVFTIDNSKPATIKASNGTEVLVPANCFTDGNGDPVTGKVTIEIVEALDMNDYITSGLATVSGDRMLVSRGMMYINASAGDTKLQLAKGSSISAAMPGVSTVGGFQMFTGDGSNWTVDSTMLQTDYAITLPLELLYPRGNRFLYYCIFNWGEKDEKFYTFDTSIISVTDKKYENTFIATEKFTERYYQLIQMTHNISYFTNRDYYFDVVDCEGQKFDYDIFKVYFDNPQRPLHESDSIAGVIFTDYFNKNEQKIAAFCEEVNVHKRQHYMNWTDTNYYFDFRKTSLREHFMRPLKELLSLNQKPLKHINTHGVNLDAVNAYDLLKAKGVDDKEIAAIQDYAFRRRKAIEYLKKQKDDIISKKQVQGMYESTVFSIKTLGWINCDIFYDDPSAGKAEMYVSNSGPDLGYVDYSLVLPDLNARLSAYRDAQGRFSFTQKDGRYIKLPIGKDAVIVGVSIQHDSVFFAYQKMVIKDGYQASLPMKYIETKALKDSLKAAMNVFIKTGG